MYSNWSFYNKKTPNNLLEHKKSYFSHGTPIIICFDVLPFEPKPDWYDNWTQLIKLMGKYLVACSEINHSIISNNQKRIQFKKFLHYGKYRQYMSHKLSLNQKSKWFYFWIQHIKIIEKSFCFNYYNACIQKLEKNNMFVLWIIHS